MKQLINYIYDTDSVDFLEDFCFQSENKELIDCLNRFHDAKIDIDRVITDDLDPDECYMVAQKDFCDDVLYVLEQSIISDNNAQ